MNHRRPLHLSAIALTLTMAGGAHAAPPDGKDVAKWAEMRKNAVPATELLASDVSNFANPVGRTDKLILNEQHTAIEYVLFDVPYPWSFYTGEDGYVRYDSVELRDGYYAGVNLQIQPGEVTNPGDQLKLTRGEVDDRMVSRLIGRDMHFADGETREISDLLIQPKTGKVTHYVVQLDADALFDHEPRTVRASQVSIDESGRVSTQARFDDIASKPEFDPDFL
ncbi:MAG: hypothetical protein ACLGI7_15490 [Gammaproteobacteria bacterium]